MGCRWVGAALVVVAVISSLSLRVEGSFESDVRRIKAAYDKILSGGKGKGEDCRGDLGSWDLRKLVNISGMSEGGVRDHYTAAYPVEEGRDVWVNSYANDVEKLAGNVEEECAVKSVLVCHVDNTCVSCAKVDKGQVDTRIFCDLARKIVEAHEASNGGGSGGNPGGGVSGGGDSGGRVPGGDSGGGSAADSGGGVSGGVDSGGKSGGDSRGGSGGDSDKASGGGVSGGAWRLRPVDGALLAALLALSALSAPLPLLRN